MDQPSDDQVPPEFRTPRRKKLSLSDPLKIDRLPPHSLEAEQGVLGCLMLSPRDCLPEYIAKFKEPVEAFYDLRHQEIIKSMIALGDKCDLITLQQHLRDRQQLESVGGLAFLSQLPDAVPSAANFSYYAEIVFEKYILRKAIQTCTDVVAKAYEHEGKVDELLDQIEKDVLGISNAFASEELVTIKSLVQGAVKQIQFLFENKGALTGIPTGFVDLDRMTSGLQNGDMIVVAARPSMGKTSLAMNMAEHIAIESKLPVGVFSLEMTAQSLVMRMLCSSARVNPRAVRDGFLSERDFPKIVSSTGKLSNAPLFIDDTPGLSIMQLRARARRMVQQYGVKLFVIDYLQLLHSTSKRAKENRQQEVSDISSGVKAMAKELNVPVIILSQLNRELEKDKNRKPRLSDIRESGSVEQDADLIGLLYKPAQEDSEGESSQCDAVPVNLLIAKQRNGPCGDIPLTFMKSWTRFESAARVSNEDLPS